MTTGGTIMLCVVLPALWGVIIGLIIVVEYIERRW